MVKVQLIVLCFFSFPRDMFVLKAAGGGGGGWGVKAEDLAYRGFLTPVSLIK